MSDHVITINASPGTTGTRTIHKVLEYDFKIVGEHYFHELPHLSHSNKGKRDLTSKQIKNCYEVYDNHNFTQNHTFAEVIYIFYTRM